MSNKNRIYHLLGCFSVCVFILIIRHALVYPLSIVKGIRNISMVFTNIIEAYNLTELYTGVQLLPPIMVVGFLGLLCMLLGYGILLVFHRNVRYSSQLMQYNLIGIIKRGLVVYLCQMFVISVFIYSIIGIPIGVAVLLIMLLVNLYGMVPLAVGIGENIQEIFRGDDRRITYNYIIGAIFLLVCMNVYAVGVAFVCFFIPVLATGVAVYSIEMKVFKMPAEGDFNEKKEPFDKRRIRDIITKGLDG